MLLDFSNFWQLKDDIISHLTWVVFLQYLAKLETRKLHFFHFSVVCCFANKHTLAPLGASLNKCDIEMSAAGDILSFGRTCVECLLAKQHTVFKWKDIISMFQVSQDSAETLAHQVSWELISVATFPNFLLFHQLM